MINLKILIGIVILLFVLYFLFKGPNKVAKQHQDGYCHYYGNTCPYNRQGGCPYPKFDVTYISIINRSQ
jgi:hypothetical protein